MLSAPRTAAADTYTVERAVISATGGTATGGPFRLNFTVGQSSAGTQTGANAKLVSGFWWEVSGNAVDAGREPLPTQFALGPNAPNPFGARTMVRYAIPAGDAAPIFLGIYDLRGALIRTLVRETQPPGAYSTSWDGRDENGQSVGPGVYFIRFEGPGFRQHRRVVVLR
jgi:hypothetical protein